MADSSHEIEAWIIYDGEQGPYAIMDDQTMNFHLPAVMPARHYLPFLGLKVEHPVPYGESGKGRFFLIATDRERKHLVRNTEFELYAANRRVAAGTILSSRDVTPASTSSSAS